MATLRALALPPGKSAPVALSALEGVLAGRGSPLVPMPAGKPRDCALLTAALRVGEQVDDDIALVIATSGTTGTPKGALLTPAALLASASAAHDRLGGPGRWLLALPAHHIAGVGVLVRSALAGTVPVELDISAGFDPAGLPAAVGELGGGRRYTALVANQLAKALGHPAAAAALADLDAVLLGGGPAPQPLLDAAAAAGIAVVRTYGSSETAGGCAYDGLALAGVRVRVERPGPTGEGRIAVGGATLARGHRNPQQPDPFGEPGWYHTDDIGRLDESGRLTVLGRADEAIRTGGVTVLPGPVEAVLNRHPAVDDCAVFAVSDDRLGERVVAAVVANRPVSLDELRRWVSQSLDPTAAPRELRLVSELPRRGIGKLDRRALRRRWER